MSEHEPAGRELAQGAKVLTAHLLAVVAGLALMVAGLGMGVTIVLLPVGLPVGLVGLCSFLWGMFGWSEGKKEITPPPGQPPSEGPRR